MPKNSVKHGTNADVFGSVDGQHVRAESNTVGQPWKSDCCEERKRKRNESITNQKNQQKKLSTKKQNKTDALIFKVSHTEKIRNETIKNHVQNVTHSLYIRSHMHTFFVSSKIQYQFFSSSSNSNMKKTLKFAHFERDSFVRMNYKHFMIYSDDWALSVSQWICVYL